MNKINQEFIFSFQDFIINFAVNFGKEIVIMTGVCDIHP
jgi:hypothetical protein